jgi:two-component system chemotaxis response regulator CheB
MQDRIRVLIVDDSAFFRKRIREELERDGQILVAGEASNGREAVAMSRILKPDVITMDVAMPEMDGIAAVREIMRSKPTDILMLSSLTRDGARATLDALEAGAVDFLPKQGVYSVDSPACHTLSGRVVGIARRQRTARLPPAAPAARQINHSQAKITRPAHRPGGLKLVVIGASTGGPVAIQRVLSALPADYRYPVLVAVHMPAEFTATFAERLDAMCGVNVGLASDGAALVAGSALIAPGGQQTLVEQRNGRLRVCLKPGGEQLYKPSVDVVFGSAARALEGAVQAVVLTGMGADGTEGARLLKEKGASVWSQDQASSVVYGMPLSVFKAGHTDRVLPLDEIGSALAGLA